MKEFFGIGGYSRTPEGYMSFGHIAFVGGLMTFMIVLAVVLGIVNRKKDDKKKNIPLIIGAILIDALEILKAVILHLRGVNLWIDLPLFLCSIQLFTIPLAAFTTGPKKTFSTTFTPWSFKTIASAPIRFHPKNEKILLMYSLFSLSPTLHCSKLRLQ